MIPLRLELANFLSYRKAAVLDFDGIHLACVSGANGAGKSSILDGMTWALFGKSRSTHDIDDVINRQAAAKGEAAEVRFTFELEGVTYRLIRRKPPGKGKTTTLEFQVAAGQESWKALTESKVRDTEAAIVRLLRMNYDTFISASFLLQDKADEFTKKKPNERKEILAALIGVNQWDLYKEAAAARRKEAESQLARIDDRLAGIDQELAEEPEREAALAAARSALAQVSEQLAIQEKLLKELRRTEEAIKYQRQRVKSLEESVGRAGRNLESLRQNRGQRRAERDRLQQLLDQAEAIQERYLAWQAAEALFQEWQAKADGYNAILQARRPHELALEGERARLTQRRKELEERGGKVAEMAGERGRVAESLESGRIRLSELAGQLSDLAEQERAWHEARERLQELESERKLLTQEAGQLQSRARQAAAQGQERRTVEQNHAEAEQALASAVALLAAVAEQEQRLMAAMGDRDRLKAEQVTLKADMDKLRDRLDRLDQETGGECPLCGQELTDEHRQNVLESLTSDGQAKGDRYRENQDRLQALAAEIKELDAGVRRRELAERDRHAQQQRLATAQARLEEIERGLAEWEADGAGRLTEVEKLLADDAALKEQQAAVADLAAALKDKAELEEQRQAAQRQLSAAEARLAEINRAAAEWEGDESSIRNGHPERSPRAELAEVTARLAADDIAPEAQAALAELEQQAAELGYDPAAHQEARQGRDALAEAQTSYQQLQQAQAAVRPLDDNLASLDGQIDEQQQALDDLARQRDEAQTQLVALEAGGGDLAAAEEAAQRRREEEIAAHRSVATAQQMVEVLAEMRQQKQQALGERDEVTHLVQRLLLLEKACGPEGVQALLIERALPDIEDDANELLDRLTGGQMRVVFDTQKKLKTSDGLRETLDIKIVDAAGERPYENFSGGEQFRVNFAVRLALSRILAKRAGARLQTLVIDEGFGSQDPYGRQRLVEAINTIQGDFERILVITHIDELRDAFPTRIEVEKGPAGSTITVV